MKGMFSALINLFPSFDTAPDVEDHELMVVDMSVCGIHQQVQLQQNLSLKFMVPYFRLMKMVRDWCREICLCRTFFKSLNKYF